MSAAPCTPRRGHSRATSADAAASPDVVTHDKILSDVKSRRQLLRSCIEARFDLLQATEQCLCDATGTTDQCRTAFDRAEAHFAPDSDSFYAFHVFTFHALRAGRMRQVVTVRDGVERPWSPSAPHLPVTFHLRASEFLTKRMQCLVKLGDVRTPLPRVVERVSEAVAEQLKRFCTDAKDDPRVRSALTRLREQAVPRGSPLADADVSALYEECVLRTQIYIIADGETGLSGPFGDEVFLDHLLTDESILTVCHVFWHETAHNFVRFLRIRHHTTTLTEPVDVECPCIVCLTAEELPSPPRGRGGADEDADDDAAAAAAVPVAPRPDSLFVEVSKVLADAEAEDRSLIAAQGWDPDHFVHVEAGYFFDCARKDNCARFARVYLTIPHINCNASLCPFSGWPKLVAHPHTPQ